MLVMNKTTGLNSVKSCIVHTKVNKLYTTTIKIPIHILDSSINKIKVNFLYIPISQGTL